ncbi:MAG TPA: urea carboxylase-associated family protein [Candidatus Dormibacteraeota bacterium]
MTEVLIPAGEGRAFHVPNGALLEIIDVEGQQVADFISIIENDPKEWLSATHTRSTTLRLNLNIGDRLQTNWRRDMYEVVSDDVGMHDLITSMCDARRYRIDYGVENHRSCRSNFLEALAPWRYQEWQIPDVINVFQNAPIHADRTFGNEIPLSKPGDKIVLRALLDGIVAAISACPQDLNPCNGFNPSPIQARILT